MTENNKTLLYHSIGQVARHVGLPQSVLRYWETVFPMLRPEKSAGGSRQYSERDIRLILQIKDLLYTQGFTIKGAKARLKAESPSAKEAIVQPQPEPEVKKPVDMKIANNQPETDETDDILSHTLAELKKLAQMLDE